MSEKHANSTAYVRTEMLGAKPAPVSQTGLLRWLRENLFSNWVNAALTLVGLYFVYFLFTHFYPWFAHSVWNANSIMECRDTITAEFGEGATGACWAVIQERWHQFMFGFYPRELYWRPLLALGLLMTVMGPILFSEVVRNRLIFMGFAAVFALVTMALVGTPMSILAMTAVILAAVSAAIAFRFSFAMLAAAIFPLVAIFLLWGGSIWTVIFIGLGFVIAGLVMRVAGNFGAIMSMALGALAAVLFWAFVAGPLGMLIDKTVTMSNLGEAAVVAQEGLETRVDAAASALAELEAAPDTPRAALRTAERNLAGAERALRDYYGKNGFIGIESVGSDRFGGFLLAITIGVGGIAMSLPLGIVLALGRQSNMFLIKTLSVVFIEFIRGVPLITLLFVASLLLNYFLPPGTQFDIILRVMILVTMFSAAYIAEVIRGGLAALPRGQYEAADALGLDYWKAQRLIILPQALKISIPGIVSTFIGMFKDTTLVVFVGLFDPLKGIPDFIRSVFEWKGIYWEFFVFVGAIFFIINFAMSRYSMYLENRLKREHR
ncbi:amino acid ABC transporter permease [Pseudothioclava arenosa]|uniref:amino acid ABC transporter permease n=1 Tax=Pseudothioclava arenosa TaxID=1795308 RepID=UPI001FE73955|nr:amino acid ABC transporter permease [Pseudothioclava arenosa]